MSTDSTKRPDPADLVERLYPLVSEAIQRAETLADLDSPAAPAAFVEVSQLEERIAEHLPASDPEGALARRGAVRAAIMGGQISRARALADRFVEDPEADDELRKDLRTLLEEAEEAQADTCPKARHTVTDDVLVNRVRSGVEYMIDNPKDVTVTALGGRVTLSGTARPGEAERLTRHVSQIPGVDDVENQLEAPRSAHQRRVN